jgi:hypothetical protein
MLTLLLCPKLGSLTDRIGQVNSIICSKPMKITLAVNGKTCVERDSRLVSRGPKITAICRLTDLKILDLVGRDFVTRFCHDAPHIIYYATI